MVSNRNKKNGNLVEQELCERLFYHGFWAHNMAQNRDGQPADVIAVRNKHAHLIDCKDCENDEFPFSRIEDNQKTAMHLWKECGNGEGWFALKLGEEIYMIALVIMETLSAKKSKLTREDILNYGIHVDRWERKCK